MEWGLNISLMERYRAVPKGLSITDKLWHELSVGTADLTLHFLQSVLAAEVCTALLIEAHELDPGHIA